MIVTSLSLSEEFFASEKKEFPHDLPCLQGMKESLAIHSSVLFFVGENGAGKTTLLESIAYGLGMNRYGGGKNFVRDETKEPPLSKFLTIAKRGKVVDAFFFRAETFFNLDQELHRYGVVEGSPELVRQYTGSDRSFRELSHGQGFRAFFENRLRPGGLYLLDEPESALSVQSQIELLFLLREFSKEGCQFIVSTHSPVLLCLAGAQILLFDKGPLREVALENAPPFRDMTGFLANYERYQKEM